jgi:hypothetical protein
VLNVDNTTDTSVTTGWINPDFSWVQAKKIPCKSPTIAIQ